MLLERRKCTNPDRTQDIARAIAIKYAFFFYFTFKITLLSHAFICSKHIYCFLIAVRASILYESTRDQLDGN